MLKHLLFFMFVSLTAIGQENLIFISQKGEITFRSEAQQELIKATSSDLRGVINTSKRMFLFKVTIRTFSGFNSALQQEHFNEKYLESDKYPEAVFYGKIIEDIDLSIDGSYEIRAKGKLSIHGVELEKIIRVKVVTTNGVINVESNFNIVLSDYRIKIPKVVHEKIANEISVEINTELTKNVQFKK